MTVAAGNAIRGHAGSATNAFYGVDGFSNSVHALAAGVRGLGAHKGIYGTGYGYFNAAGVFGNQYFGFPIALAAGYAGAGVRGEGVDTGVLGISRTQGVAGSLVDNAGTETSWGVVASNVGIDVAGPPWAFFGGGNIGATGTKYFLDPDPNDASRAIAYVSLEGPEAGTYFRGRARFQNGMARIPVPEHFRLVTDAEGLTVQITPIGEMATVAVVRMDLEEIVVKASRNVEFSYLVQGIRETHKHVAPFRDSSEFAPRAADSKIPDWLTAAQRRRLIQNGTYREDGTANTDTARRLGWDRIWEARSRPAREPGEP